MNKLYFGDNLEILREFEPNSIDLICTDPPFNSGRDYNIFLASKAQQKAFKDMAFSQGTTSGTQCRAHPEARVSESEATVAPNDRYTRARSREGHRRPRGHQSQLRHCPPLDPRLEA